MVGKDLGVCVMVEKILTFKKIESLGKRIFFFFEERDYSVIYNKEQKRFFCDCVNGSLYGVNDKQVCRHKQKCINFIEELKQRNPIYYYYLTNPSTKVIYHTTENVPKEQDYTGLYEEEQ